MEVGLPPDLLRLRQPEQAPDDLFRTQAELIDALVRQRDRARALSARLVVLSLVLLSALAAAMAALVARGVGAL